MKTRTHVDFFGRMLLTALGLSPLVGCGGSVATDPGDGGTAGDAGHGGSGGSGGISGGAGTGGGGYAGRGGYAGTGGYAEGGYAGAAGAAGNSFPCLNPHESNPPSGFI